ncbi:hypothetical protein R1sor_011702 [Riccia sorocarpa]|uniref:Uncharacterized protein n=1 Tax=Riccia sorocarpa TaxID=122646 RepID=A0ABD3I2P2_9MARC
MVKLKRFRRTFEGIPVSDERFLELQGEIHRLKKELHSKDEQQKLLLVKVHRAQETAKKNLRTGVEQGLHTLRDRNAVMGFLLQQNHAEERIHELELRLRECHKDTQRYLEFSRKSKAEAESLKKKLDASVRASRRERAPAPLDVSRRHEKMVNKLKAQILRLKEENKELRIRAPDGHVPDDSRDPTSARLEVVSVVVPNAPHNKVRKAPRHRQQEIEKNRVTQSLVSGGFGRANEQQSTSSATGRLLQEASEVQVERDSQELLQVTAQLMKTSEDLDRLKKKYERTSEELHQLKINHSKCLKKLQDTYSELTQERKVRQELEVEKKNISGELAAAQHLKSNLQQLRQQNLQLENENAELLNAALNVPRTNFAEIKGLREQLVEELKQRNLAVSNAAKLTTQLEECKRDLARLAVVEANWQYLKTELEAANKSVTTGNLKVAELETAKKLLQKQRLRLSKVSNLREWLSKNISNHLADRPFSSVEAARPE